MRICVLGFGKSGYGSTLLAKEKFYDVFVSEMNEISENDKNFLYSNKINFEDKGHSIENILKSDLVIKSPGIPNNCKIVQLIKQNNILITDELNFAAQFTNAFLIGVTGTNGKSTIVSMVYHIMNFANYDVDLCGNIGNSFAQSLSIRDKKYFVLEMSSFQLEYWQSKLNIACISNISRNHLNRYNYDYNEYIKTKFNILNNMTENDSFIYLKQEGLINQYIQNYSVNKIAIDENNLLNYNLNDQFSVCNCYNAAMAIEIANIVGIDKQTSIQALKTFVNLPHRVEYITTYNGVKFYDDSKSTTVASTKIALQNFDDHSVILLAGGIDKGNDYNEILSVFKKKVKCLVCLGKDNTTLINFFSKIIDQVYSYDNMTLAVAKAIEYSQPKDNVLLSPMCASQDLFKNYDERGFIFKEKVLKLGNY